MPRSIVCLCLFTVLACRSTAPSLVEADPALREGLFAPVKALAGTWRVEAAEHPSEIRFEVSSNGSVVRETMFPGTENEMTNMYALDGNSLVMTHYCAGGNQPRMRARALEGNRLVFEADGVSDLQASEDHYMGAITLVFVDADQLEQRWVSYETATGKPGGMTFQLTRVH